MPRFAVDAVVAVAVFVVTVAVASHRQVDLLGFLLVAGTSAPLPLWRFAPAAVFAVTSGSGVLLAAFGYPVDLLLGPVVGLYALASSREESTPWTTRHSALVVGMFAALLATDAMARGEFPVLLAAHTGLAWAVGWFAGERTRLARVHLADLRRTAIAEERARIARDLHDSAGHAINVIAVRAGAARLGRDPDRSTAALAAIEELARQTAEDIDHIVSALRTDDGVEAIGLAALDALLARHRSAGLRVTVTETGSSRAVDRAADQAAYRILQEALTNAARHGDGDAQVALHFDQTTLTLTVVNPIRADRATRTGGGHGLIGMRERAESLGGHLDIDQVDGRFELRADIPARWSTP